MRSEPFNIISYCDIPEDITEGHWISEFQNGCYVPYNIPLQVEEDNPLGFWLFAKYPHLAGDEILIDIDY